MSIIVQGMLEIHMSYDKQHTVIEWLGVGSILNSFNFIAEELMQLNATVATNQLVVY